MQQTIILPTHLPCAFAHGRFEDERYNNPTLEVNSSHIYFYLTCLLAAEAIALIKLYVALKQQPRGLVGNLTISFSPVPGLRLIFTALFEGDSGRGAICFIELD